MRSDMEVFLALKGRFVYNLWVLLIRGVAMDFNHIY